MKVVYYHHARIKTPGGVLKVASPKFAPILTTIAACDLLYKTPDLKQMSHDFDL